MLLSKFQAFSRPGRVNYKIQDLSGSVANLCEHGVVFTYMLFFHSNVILNGTAHKELCDLADV